MRIAILMACALGGCSAVPLAEPRSIGEVNASYNYTPLDPLPVNVKDLHACQNSSTGAQSLVNYLPDNAVRIGVERLTGDGQITAGPAVVGVGGNRYRVTLDYINAATSNVRFRVALRDGDELRRPNRALSADDAIYIERSVDAPAIISPEPDTPPAEGQSRALRLPERRMGEGRLNYSNSIEVVIPIYIGVGLRLTSLIDVLKGSVNLASLGAIALSVNQNRAYGSLTVQTLGVNGEQVAASLPLPSELNETTVQNAIQSLGSIKAIMYDPDTQLTPRVIGIYNPLPANAENVNAIVSQLAGLETPWQPTCTLSASEALVGVSNAAVQAPAPAKPRPAARPPR